MIEDNDQARKVCVRGGLLVFTTTIIIIIIIIIVITHMHTHIHIMRPLDPFHVSHHHGLFILVIFIHLFESSLISHLACSLLCCGFIIVFIVS